MKPELLKHALQGIIAAAKAQEEPLDHLLFYGPKEYGAGRLVETAKQLAQFVARESGAHLRVTYASTNRQFGSLAALLTHLRTGDILFIDDILALDQDLKDFLYTAMKDFVFDIVVGKGASSKNVRLNLPRFTVVSATTNPGKLAKEIPLLFGIQIRIDADEPDQPASPSDVIVRLH